jgi:hypothetical protein
LPLVLGEGRGEGLAGTRTTSSGQCWCLWERSISFHEVALVLLHSHRTLCHGVELLSLVDHQLAG